MTILNISGGGLFRIISKKSHANIFFLILRTSKTSHEKDIYYNKMIKIWNKKSSGLILTLVVQLELLKRMMMKTGW